MESITIRSLTLFGVFFAFRASIFVQLFDVLQQEMDHEFLERDSPSLRYFVQNAKQLPSDFHGLGFHIFTRH